MGITVNSTRLREKFSSDYSTNTKNFWLSSRSVRFRSVSFRFQQNRFNFIFFFSSIYCDVLRFNSNFSVPYFSYEPFNFCFFFFKTNEKERKKRNLNFAAFIFGVFALDEIRGPAEAPSRVLDQPRCGSPFLQRFDGTILVTQFELLRVQKTHHIAVLRINHSAIAFIGNQPSLASRIYICVCPRDWDRYFIVSSSDWTCSGGASHSA